MKEILIVYPHMAIGGSTTSLLSILNLIDYSKYHVDLLLGAKRGELLSYIPKEVNILEQSLPNEKILKIRKIISPGYLVTRFKTRNCNSNTKNQWMNYQNVRFSRKNSKKYDVAIAFLETYSCYYVSECVNAAKKIFWLHLDYAGAGFDRQFDKKFYEKFESIVLVSEACRKSFEKSFPEFERKALVIQNILASKYVRERSNEECKLQVDNNYINLVTICRIVFKHKGLDRGVLALSELKKKGIKNVRWYIIGDGEDSERLKALINENGLEDNIILLGSIVNPYPYLRKMDAFFLPSRYEGKPMAVTEAMMLGVPPIVANYASAKEQVNHGSNGYIFENTQEGITKGLYQLLSNKQMILDCKNKLLDEDYSNLEEMEKINELLN